MTNPNGDQCAKHFVCCPEANHIHAWRKKQVESFMEPKPPIRFLQIRNHVEHAKHPPHLKQFIPYVNNMSSIKFPMGLQSIMNN